MGSYVMPVIVESEHFLKKQLSQQRSGRLKERLQVAYLVKSGQAQELNTLARLVGRGRATVMRWLERYRVGGLSGYWSSIIASVGALACYRRRCAQYYKPA